VSSDMGYMVSV